MSVADVTGHLGLAPGLVRYYFDSKDGLISRFALSARGLVGAACPAGPGYHGARDLPLALLLLLF